MGVVAWRRMAERAAEELKNLGLDINPRARLGDFPIGVQQLVELSRVLFSGARIIILDEPTSALSPPEIERLFGVLAKLREEGRSMIFISHFLDDILKISNAITIFRNGRKVETAEVTPEIDKALDHRAHDRHGPRGTGGELSRRDQARQPPRGAGRAAGEGPDARAFLSQSHSSRRGPAKFSASTVSWAAGSSNWRGPCSASIVPRADRSRSTARSKALKSTTAAKKAGVAYVAESRRAMLFGDEPVYKNVSIAVLERLSKWLLKPDREREIAKVQVKNLDVRPPDIEWRLGGLSGGNQQKVALAKWLTHPPRILLLAEPTRGMDVGAKEDVVRIVRHLRDSRHRHRRLLHRARNRALARRPRPGDAQGRDRA